MSTKPELHPVPSTQADLQSFIELLRRNGQLACIDVPVSPRLEIAAVTARTCRRRGPALLFRRLSGYDMPVLTNAFGSMERMRLALGTEDLDGLARKVLHLIDSCIQEEEGAREGCNETTRESRPRLVSAAPCQHVVLTGEKVDLDRIPALHSWPGDAGRAFTLPVVFTKDPETGRRNVGLYRMQLLNRDTTCVHWMPGSGGAEHHAACRRLGRRLDMAVAIGPEPAMTYAASTPLPHGVDEVLLAGLLTGCPVEMVRCKTIDMEVPAHSQIILEGYVDPAETRMEGPFGNHTGYYGPRTPCPVFHVTCMTMRRDAIFQATVVGPPPQEDCFMAKATERLFLPLLKRKLPEIVDVNMPVEGIFGNMVFVSIDKQYPGHAMKVMDAMWACGPWSRFKMIFVFDASVDVQDLGQVLWRLGNNTHPVRDTVVRQGQVHRLDPTSDTSGFGGRIGFDCTVKWPEEMSGKTWPTAMELDSQTRARAEDILAGIVEGHRCNSPDEEMKP